ncbi:MAG: BadF/BadG/BcrA/BcrD ATPase family, partial [Verrucomicrobiota bacterium]
RIGDLTPIVFATAAGGDRVARAIIDRLADELAVMAAALARRSGLTTRDPAVQARLRRGIEAWSATAGVVTPS